MLLINTKNILFTKHTSVHRYVQKVLVERNSGKMASAEHQESSSKSYTICQWSLYSHYVRMHNVIVHLN